MRKTPEQVARSWQAAASAAARNYGQEPPIEEQYDDARESYARGSTTFEDFGKRVDALLARGL